MENKLQVFPYEGKEIRTVMIGSEPWWVLKDVCSVLGIEKHRDAAARLDDDERGSVVVDTLGGRQEMTAINESGLYMQTLAETNCTHSIPAMMSTDPRTQNVAFWPQNMALSATFDPYLAHERAQAHSIELRALGIHSYLGPLADLASEPRWYRLPFTISEDPALARDVTMMTIDGMQSTFVDGIDIGWGEHSVISVVKHWPGDSSSEGGRGSHHYWGAFNVFPGGQFETHLIPFVDGAFNLPGLTGMAAGLMSNYSVAWSEDGSLGELVGAGFSYFMTQLVRDYGFDGPIVTDWNIHRTRYYGVEYLTEEERILMIFMHGHDQVGGGSGWTPPELILEAIEMGVGVYGYDIVRTRIEEAVRRSLANMFKVGIFENPFLCIQTSLSIVMNDEFVEAAFDATQRSIIMLKNDGVISENWAYERFGERPLVYVPIAQASAGLRIPLAKYLRYSNDDGKTGDSESVKNQRDLLDQYISRHEDLQGCEVVEFLDDGYTGINFQRPGFTSMIEAIKERKVSCIIVKDFSRFGRNYIEVSDYIDQIFPFLGVRFIAINEQYDSKTATASLGLDMAMKNIVYDLYSKDLSKKIRSARKSLMKKGEYIASFAIYGYTNKVEKKRLVIDPYAAEVVKKIFDYAVNGDNARKIAIKLNDEGILPPNAYNKSKSTKKMHYIPMDTAALWTADIVRRIIQDERYVGNMVCGKSEYRNGKTILLPKKDWVITPGTHEAIISEEIFHKAQEVLRTRKQFIAPKEPRSILVGSLKCAYCNKSLVFEGRRRRHFYCHTFNMGLGCEQAAVAEEVLIDTIFSVIKAKLELVQASEQHIMAERQTKADKRNAERRECEARLKRLKHSQTAILEQFMEGELLKESYQKQKLLITTAIQEATDRLTALEAQNETTLEFAESHRPYFNQESLTRDMVKGLIKEIRVTSADEIEIVWKFREFYESL